MSVQDEYHAHKRREQALYVLAFDEFEQNLTPEQRRMLGSAAVPNIEDTRSHDSRRESLGVSVDLVNGDVLGEWNPRPECLASALGVSLEKGCKIFEWHNKAAARSGERIKMWAVIRIAGVSLDCANTRLAAPGLAFEGGLSLQFGLGRIQDCAASMEVSRAAIYKNVKFWQREFDLLARFSLEQVILCKLVSPQVDGFDRSDILLQKLTGSIYSQKSSKDRGCLAWHNRAKPLKAEKSKGCAMERIAGGLLDCANSKLTAVELAYASDLGLTANLGTMQEYALKIAVFRSVISKNAKLWQRELDLPAASIMRGAEKAKHWRNQKFTFIGV